MKKLCCTCVRASAGCVWIFVWTCECRRCFYQSVERSLHEFKTAAFSSKSRWAHLSCVRNQNNTWQLWQLSPNCNVSAWLDPEEYWACARQQDWTGRGQNAKSVFSRFEFGFISSSLKGRREMQNLYLPVLNLDSFPVLLKVGEKCSYD